MMRLHDGLPPEATGCFLGNATLMSVFSHVLRDATVLKRTWRIPGKRATGIWPADDFFGTRHGARRLTALAGALAAG
jgi:hypothetical protein